MSVTLDPTRLERFNGPDIHLIAGVGDGVNGKFDACIMQAVDWLAGGDGKTDAPPCVAPTLRAYCIRLNDSGLFRDYRDLLKPYAIKVAGTAPTTRELELQRAFIAADDAVHIFSPIYLRALGFDEWATTCEAQPRIVDRASAREACTALHVIRRAALDNYYAKRADAAAAADADADAVAAVADVAVAAVAAAAAVAADAADAVAAAAAVADADAVAVAVVAADARRKVWATKGDELRAAALATLDKMLAVGQDEA